MCAQRYLLTHPPSYFLSMRLRTHLMTWAHEHALNYTHLHIQIHRHSLTHLCTCTHSSIAWARFHTSNTLTVAWGLRLQINRRVGKCLVTKTNFEMISFSCEGVHEFNSWPQIKSTKITMHTHTPANAHTPANTRSHTHYTYTYAHTYNCKHNAIQRGHSHLDVAVQL